MMRAALSQLPQMEHIVLNILRPKEDMLAVLEACVLTAIRGIMKEIGRARLCVELKLRDGTDEAHACIHHLAAAL
jgi:hypothetical protein